MTDTLINALQLNKRGVISLFGAGGKTSLMFELVKQLEKSGKRVLTTTTTKIFMPKKCHSPVTIVEENINQFIKKAKSTLKEYYHFSAASNYDPASNKLKGLTLQFIHKLWQARLFDWIIVETDGAKQKPLKASNLYEPVIPKDTSHLILVTGLDSIGKPLDDNHVHRPEIFSDNTGLGIGKLVDEQSIAKSIGIEMAKTQTLCNPQFNILFLNKADTFKRQTIAKKIAKLAHNITCDKADSKIDRIIIASLKDKVVVKNHTRLVTNKIDYNITK